jgi:sporulation protein YlmC with PRC-barrel domain
MKRVIAVLAVVMLVCVLVGAQAFAAGEKERGQTYERGTTQQQMTGERARMGGQATANRASEIIGRTVKNDKGENLGTVNDIVIDRRGEVQYIILSHGGLLGIGDKLIPIPFRAARMDMQEDTLVLQNVDKQKLEQAPNISQQEWEKLAQPDFERRVYSYYGQEQREPGMMQRYEEQPRQRQQ